MTSFLTTEWQHLVMVNYQVDPALLLPLVPLGTELDQWNGKTLVSLVALRFRKTRLMSLPIPLHRDFEELNLRFYVRRDEGDAEPRRGVVFIQEIVPRLAITAVARWMYNEPYRTLPMRSEVQASPPPSARYEWLLDGRWHSCAAAATTPGAVPVPGTEAAFITEHYSGFTRQRDGGTIEYQVEHRPWTVWPADVRLDADLAALYGKKWGAALERPSSTFIADGAPVAVHWPTKFLAAINPP